MLPFLIPIIFVLSIISVGYVHNRCRSESDKIINDILSRPDENETEMDITELFYHKN